jgi:phage shock protein E
MSNNVLPIVVVVAVFVAFQLIQRLGKVDPSEARRLVGEGAALVDVRTPAEFASGHLDEAVNIPLQQLADRLGELPAKDQPIVVYCRSGARSGNAKRMLGSRGYTAVSDLGAMSRW